MNETDQDGEIIPITEWPVIHERGDNEAEKLLYKKISTQRRPECPEYQPQKKMCFTEEQMANVAVAKWWRQKTAEFKNGVKLPDSTNPNTLLRAVCRSKPGMVYIESQVERLKEKLTHNEHSASVHACLGSFLEKLENYSDAKKHFDLAVKLQPSEHEYSWHLGRINKQLLVQKSQRIAQQELLSETKDKNYFNPKQVERIAAEDLSSFDFYDKFSSKGRPVIITGLVDKMTPNPWTLQHIKNKAGGLNVNVKKHVADSSEWARLEDCKCMTVEQYIDSIQCQNNSQQYYLFDWSLPIHCPQLAKELTIPKYFADDFLQRTAPDSLYADSWPSLFIAQKGLCSDLHVDAFGSNFWMALFEGKKKWTFFPRSDLPLLYPRYEISMDPIFDIDLTAPDHDRHPLFSCTTRMECILSPGELLFVPAGSPHFVENLSNSLAISANFVDASNFDLVMGELEMNSLIDPRAKDLLQQFKNKTFDKEMRFL